MLVPLIENHEIDSEGADFFIKRHVSALMAKQKEIDAIILACTHYPLIADKIRKELPPNVKVLSQGKIVAEGLADYLKRHPEIEKNCSKGGAIAFFTTDQPEPFDNAASLFYGKPVRSSHISI